MEQGMRTVLFLRPLCNTETVTPGVFHTVLAILAKLMALPKLVATVNFLAVSKLVALLALAQ
eukprot:3553526-Amphidinium_carterae.3